MAPTVDVSIAPGRDELDRKLVMRSLRGDRHSLDRLFAAHARRYFNLSYRTCLDRELAAQNTSHAFSTVARRLPELKLSHGSFELLLLTAVAGRSLDAVTRASSPLLEGPISPEPASAYANPAAAVDHADNQLMLRSAVARMLPRHRKLLAMADGAGFSCRHIALALGEPERAVAGSLARARMRLLEELRIAGAGYGAMGEACAGALPTLGLCVGGTLAEPDAELLQAHLAECPNCSENLAAMREARDAYRGWLDLAAPLGLTSALELPSIPRVGALAGARHSTARRVAASVAITASIAVIALSAAVSPSIEPSSDPPAAVVEQTSSPGASDAESAPARRDRPSRRGASSAGEGTVTETAQSAPAPSPSAGQRRAPGDDAATPTRTRRPPTGNGGARAGTLPSGGSEPEQTDEGLAFTQVPIIGRPVQPQPTSEPGPDEGQGQGGEDSPGAGGGQTAPGPPGDE